MRRHANQNYLHLLTLCLTTNGLLLSSNAKIAAEDLVWKFEAGKQYDYQMVQEMDMTMNLGPTGNTTTNVKQTMDMKWNVEALDENGTATITQQIHHIQMEITAPGQDTVRYDTNSDETPQGFAGMLAPMLSALTSETFTVTMQPNGEITEVDIPQAFVDAMSRAPGAAMMGGLASKEGLKHLAQQGSLTLPKEADLVEGHEWSNSTEIDNPATGTVKIDTSYRYLGSREVEGQVFEVFAPTINTSFGTGPQANGAKH